MHNYLLKRFRAVTRQQSMSLQSLQRATVKVNTLEVQDLGFWILDLDFGLLEHTSLFKDEYDTFLYDV
jgi:hypothetical protein